MKARQGLCWTISEDEDRRQQDAREGEQVGQEEDLGPARRPAGAASRRSRSSRPCRRPHLARSLMMSRTRMASSPETVLSGSNLRSGVSVMIW
ncbi:MAG: hypothetical protein MZV64_34270 [Ignavibacteriales bacterium]|nr:hypothetical protein [Ignavibacteriales bacterium]